jgi:hypothetical protein
VTAGGAVADRGPHPLAVLLESSEVHTCADVLRELITRSAVISRIRDSLTT